MNFSSKSADETQALAAILLKKYSEHRIWLLEGELAAGKTEVVKGLAKALGCKENIFSPTFAYLHEYGNILFHYDLYRLKTYDEELMQLLNEHCQVKAHIAIEWPSRMNLQFAMPYLHIQIDHQGGDERLIKITPH